MTIEEYLLLLESPETVDESAIEDLQSLLQYAPYCSSARMLLLKAYHRSHDTNYATQLPRTALYAQSNEQLYFLLHPKKIIRQMNASSDDYFSFIQQLQEKAERTGMSFQELALKFQQARLSYTQSSDAVGKSEPSPPVELSKDKQPTMTEETARLCIQKHDYRAALHILRELHLHNPKKSSYFADQIAFLERAIALQDAEKRK